AFLQRRAHPRMLGSRYQASENQSFRTAGNQRNLGLYFNRSAGKRGERRFAHNSVIFGDVP
ncbi:MAG: hypothetical protein AAF899_05710, partial [Pseudomonadota bacterium]